MLGPGSVAVLSLAQLVSPHIQPVSLQCWGLRSPWAVRAACLMQGLGPAAGTRLGLFPVSGVLSLCHVGGDPVPVLRLE